MAIKYVSVPGGLQRVFMLRLTLPKDTLMTLLKSIPEEMQNSPYGKSLLQHIETTQITEGSRYYDFKATDTEGKEFTLSSLEGKKILLLYEGLGCMGDNARNFLKRTYKETSRDDFEIVIYWSTPDLEELQKIKAAYECDFILVTDFLEDHNPVKIHYGAQATPSTYFIDKEGVVQLKTTGINSKKISELVNR